MLATLAPATTDNAVRAKPIAATPNGEMRRAHGTSAVAAATSTAAAMVAGWAASQLHTPSPASETGVSGSMPTAPAGSSADREPVTGDPGEKDGREDG